MFCVQIGFLWRKSKLSRLLCWLAWNCFWSLLNGYNAYLFCSDYRMWKNWPCMSIVMRKRAFCKSFLSYALVTILYYLHCLYMWFNLCSVNALRKNLFLQGLIAWSRILLGDMALQVQNIKQFWENIYFWRREKEKSKNLWILKYAETSLPEYFKFILL